jgi:hypothetical protein
MTARTRYFVVSSLLVLVVGVGSGLVAYYGGLPAGAFSNRVGPEELQYIPRDVTVLAYANVRDVMASELRQRLLRAAPGQEEGRRQFEELTGINIETDIEHVVASLGTPAEGHMPSSGIVLAQGVFNEVKIEALMREHGAQVDEYKGKRIIIAPTPQHSRNSDFAVTTPERFEKPSELAVSFLKPGLVALGTSDLIRHAIDLASGGESLATNEEVLGLVKSVDAGNVWVVGRLDSLRNVGQLPSGVNQLPPISWFSVSGQVGDGISGVVRADTTTDEAAQNLRDVVQGFVALARLQVGSKPELQSVMQSFQITGSGKTVALSFAVPGQAIDLLAPAGSLPRNRERAQ